MNGVEEAGPAGESLAKCNFVTRRYSQIFAWEFVAAALESMLTRRVKKERKTRPLFHLRTSAICGFNCRICVCTLLKWPQEVVIVSLKPAVAVRVLETGGGSSRP